MADYDIEAAEPTTPVSTPSSITTPPTPDRLLRPANNNISQSAMDGLCLSYLQARDCIEGFARGCGQ